MIYDMPDGLGRERDMGLGVGFVLTCLHMFKTQMSRKALIMQQTDNCCHIVGPSALKARQQENGQCKKKREAESESESERASTACTQIKLQIFT